MLQDRTSNASILAEGPHRATAAPLALTIGLAMLLAPSVREVSICGDDKNKDVRSEDFRDDREPIRKAARPLAG